jgi:proteasome lid subunit RPN8/RPN11
MPRTRIALDRKMLDEIRSHAASTYPEECCGLMIGFFEQNSTLKRVRELKRMNNEFAKEERYHRYTINPMEYLLTEEAASEKGEEIVGVYHSHPNAPSKPSVFDQDRAWPSLSYVIVEVRDGTPVSSNSWVLTEDRQDFIQEEMQISTAS